jgi:hypothetical protein
MSKNMKTIAILKRASLVGGLAMVAVLGGCTVYAERPHREVVYEAPAPPPREVIVEPPPRPVYAPQPVYTPPPL